MKRIIRYLLNRVPRRHIQRVVHLGMPVMALAYAGRGVECPVCGRSFRKFMPYGYVQPRGNALCPGCLALERHRLMWLYLERETDFFERKPRLLHIAPERCYIKRLEKLLGDDYITADLESPLAKVKMDVRQMPFADSEFDVVFCNHIMEHVDDDRKAMRELYRVMRPGGWGIAMSPVNRGREATYEDPSITAPEERLKAFGQRDHVREYGRDYAARLAEAGFEVEEIDYASHLSADDVRRFALTDEDIYLIRKRE